ncbi:AraC family transcriptional regulator [bacterium SCN 62-11]|nr:AraC family transcriptional regulator [Candidatus Eremiobacteraeota bacterium]ODT57592.1 MAG: AraC family transcriptional regulator [bacterium SCN 62-11]
MNSLEQLNAALAYIEENLDGEIDPQRLGAIACCSEYHFSRMFSFLAGVGLAEYIRRRRLTRAAFDLRDPEARVLDVALKYDYQSADSFARAFQALHGVPPSKAREATLKAYPRLSFQLSIQGASEMNYQIVEKPAFHIVGIYKRVPLIYEGINPHIQQMWQSLDEDLIGRLKTLSDLEPSGIISGSTNFSDSRAELSELDHWIGAATTQPCPDDLQALQIEAGDWAVFETVGPFPKTMQDVWARIYSEWFPASGYEHRRGPELVWCEKRDITLPDFRCQIWVPVQRQDG